MTTIDATDVTPVVFRVWKGKDGTVVALFPTLPADNSGRLCESYEHIGQHGGADYAGCIRRTRPATPEEYARLKAELTTIGYNLIVAPGATPAMHAKRVKTARV